MFKSLNFTFKNKGREKEPLLHCGLKLLRKQKWLNKQAIMCHQLNRVRTVWLSSLSERKMLDAFYNKYPFIKCAEMNKKIYCQFQPFHREKLARNFLTSKIEKYQLIMKMAQIMCYILLHITLFILAP